MDRPDFPGARRIGDKGKESSWLPFDGERRTTGANKGGTVTSGERRSRSRMCTGSSLFLGPSWKYAPREEGDLIPRPAISFFCSRLEGFSRCQCFPREQRNYTIALREGFTNRLSTIDRKVNVPAILFKFRVIFNGARTIFQ